MEEIKTDVKEQVEGSSPATSLDIKPDTTAEVEKTEVGKGEEVKGASKESVPWNEDPRFQKFISEKKELEDAKKSYEALHSDPDFAAFIAYKRQKESIAQAEKKVDFSSMSAEEYAEYVAEQSRQAARHEYETLVNANKQADVASREAVEFAGKYGVEKSEFEKAYAPEIVKHYQAVAQRIGMDKIDDYILANPPKEVFKSLYFDKAQEAGVRKYKQEIETAKKATFESEGKPPSSGAPKDFKSAFEQNWERFYGKTERLPEDALKRK